jgi:DNA-binding transcriptional MerR regulator
MALEHRPTGSAAAHIVPITVSIAAHILKCSEHTVRRLEAAGVLRALRTPAGVRIFDRGDVEQLAARRRKSA